MISGKVTLTGDGIDNYKSTSIAVNNGVGNYILVASVDDVNYKTSVTKHESGSTFTVFIRKCDDTVMSTVEGCSVFWIAIPQQI